MNKLLGALGLCRKAGKMVLGTTLVAQELHAGRAALVIVSSDTAKNSLDKVRKIAEHKGIECIVCDVTKKEISAALGLKREIGIVGIRKEFVNIVTNSL